MFCFPPCPYIGLEQLIKHPICNVGLLVAVTLRICRTLVIKAIGKRKGKEKEYPGLLP